MNVNKKSYYCDTKTETVYDKICLNKCNIVTNNKQMKYSWDKNEPCTVKTTASSFFIMEVLERTTEHGMWRNNLLQVI